MPQIQQIKYKQGLKLVQDYVKRSPTIQLPMLNSGLRTLHFSEQEIELFWNSSVDLRNRRDAFRDEQAFLARVSQNLADTEDPYGEDFPG